ncbi:30S ribosomal protein S14p (S29e) [Candidatus Nasuia deltocephalinicola]|nr:30S ribosomal protein S14p (S29e) [Candidatus Nasuia deltocephalinicola]
MTRKSIIEREKKRMILYNKYFLKFKNLKSIIKNKNSSLIDRYNARIKLQKLPRNSNLVRRRNRCLITGRPRGTFRRFKLSRFVIRNLAFNGQIPGIFKASW